MRIPRTTYKYRESLSDSLNNEFSKYFIASIMNPYSSETREKLTNLRLNAAGLLSFDDCHHPIISVSIDSHDNGKKLARAILDIELTGDSSIIPTSLALYENYRRAFNATIGIK